MAVGHLPRLAVLGGELQEHAGWGLRGLEQALTRLHERITALEQGEADGEGIAADAELVRSGVERTGSEMQAFMHRTASAANTLRPMLVEFLIEFRSVERVAERADDWLLEVGQAIAAERSGKTGRDQIGALEQVAERAAGLRARLELLHAVVRSGRNTHALAEHLIRTRPKLADTVDGQLRRTCGLLEKKLRQAQKQGGAANVAVAGGALQIARSDAQIWTTQAMSLLLRLRASQDRLAREAAALRHRCGLVPQPTGERDLLLAAARMAQELRENLAEAG